jgi:tRNA pseudouridine32 synthase/23S rRNA pseudouridine746 synthase
MTTLDTYSRLLDPVYADDALLIYDKPEGLLAVPGRGADKQDCLSARVRMRFADALIVHRLDMATSGLMVFARGPANQSVLSRAFAAREVNKRYQAIVDGRVAAPDEARDGWGQIDLPIAADWPNRPLRIIDPEHGKPSLTRWRLLLHDAGAGSTRLELEPVTGRSHQLRVHLRAIGHPILGDRLYAPPHLQLRANRLLLHACSLSLVHPVSGESLSFESPAPF